MAFCIRVRGGALYADRRSWGSPDTLKNTSGRHRVGYRIRYRQLKLAYPIGSFMANRNISPLMHLFDSSRPSRWDFGGSLKVIIIIIIIYIIMGRDRTSWGLKKCISYIKYNT